MKTTPFVFALLVLLPAPVFADFSLLPDHDRALPEFRGKGAPAPHFGFLEESASDMGHLSKEEKQKAVDELGSELRRQYESFKAIQKPAACSDASAEYALALRVGGRQAECADYARSCAKANLSSPQLLVQGALCEADRYQYPAAQALFEGAVARRFSTSPDYRQAVLEFSMYELFGLNPKKVDSILALEPTWNEDARARWKAVLLRSGNLDPGKFTKKETDAFLAAQIPLQPKALKSMLLSLKVGILYTDNELRAAFEALASSAKEFHSPLHWYYQAYRTVYHAYGAEFAMARVIYDAYDTYSNPWTAFPSEQNTYNYTEIYGSVCTANLLSGREMDDFKALKAKLRTGALSVADAAKQVNEFSKKNPGKADLLSAEAGLLSMLGKHEEAFPLYWKSHRACRYYNRANWGLTLEKRARKYRNMPEFAANEQRVKDAVKEITVPDAVKTYYVNWNSLNESLRERVIYGGRIWTPYYAEMLARGSKTYIKYPFELLSESPEHADMADERIGGKGYPNDNRLWDDVRGAGGELVVSDAIETFNSVHGDYNLLGHEVAHQFHRFLTEQAHPGSECITNLYAEAKKTANFPDSYAAQNQQEHFAQGVTYAMIPEDAPERYGLNRSWLVKHDPKQLSFIRTIEAGKLEEVSCSGNGPAQPAFLRLLGF